MREITAGKNEDGQRVIRVVSKYLKTAPASFLHRMFRKKNIVLNGRKTDGREILRSGDRIQIYLAEDTVVKFGGPEQTNRSFSEPSVQRDGEKDFQDLIVYEDEDVLIVNKPAGMLAQKAEAGDVSLIDRITGYMIAKGEITPESLATFRPGIVSRLDRNTSGLIPAGKSLAALRDLNELVRNHRIRKIYEAVAVGECRTEGVIRGYWIKDHRSNTVRIQSRPAGDAPEVLTRIRPVSIGKDPLSGDVYSRLEIELLTGKGHQIRAHLASLGFPLCGDVKYGAPATAYRRGQMLHARKLIFPNITEEESSPLASLSGREWMAPYPEDFKRICRDYSL